MSERYELSGSFPSDALAWTNADKDEWGVGEWTREPDKVQWKDAATGLDCLILRGPIGALCGYVGVQASHPWHGIEYNWCSRPEATQRGVRPEDKGEQYSLYSDDPKSFYRRHIIKNRSCDKEWCDHRPESLCDVHGGLTFSGACHETDDPGKGICHVSASPVWWFGFDCSHSGDESPGMPTRFRDGWYKGVWYVRRQVEKLAQQIAAVSR